MRVCVWMTEDPYPGERAALALLVVVAISYSWRGACDKGSESSSSNNQTLFRFYFIKYITLTGFLSLSFSGAVK